VNLPLISYLKPIKKVNLASGWESFDFYHHIWFIHFLICLIIPHWLLSTWRTTEEHRIWRPKSKCRQENILPVVSSLRSAYTSFKIWECCPGQGKIKEAIVFLRWWFLWIQLANRNAEISPSDIIEDALCPASRQTLTFDALQTKLQWCPLNLPNEHVIDSF
jgi:hypothetical protein